MDDQLPLLHLELTVVSEKFPLFTTVFQSGIEIMTPAGSSLGQFLGGLPGFTAEYLADTVQTIFHNGKAVDDLTALLSGERPVVALSAAMPGLAGAIFRRNSFHAALRSEIRDNQLQTQATKPLTVTLKLFNSIALERGKDLLRDGVRLPAEVLAGFLANRPALQEAIRLVRRDGQVIDRAALPQFLAQPTLLHLQIFDTMANANG